MNANNGKELVPQRGPPRDLSERREYTVNLGRKRDWFDYVGTFLYGDEPLKPRLLPFRQEVAKAIREWREKPATVALESLPLVGLMAVGFFCGMDSYNWNFAKCSADFLHAIPFGIGDKAKEMVTKATVPAYRSRPGDTPEATRSRRECIDAVLTNDSRYELAVKSAVSRGRAPLDVCEPSTVTTPSKDRASTVVK
jgi:hypothetical protein